MQLVKLTRKSTTIRFVTTHATSTRDTHVPTHHEMKRLIEEFDWASTPVGPMSAWPGTLRCAVDIVTASPVPMVLLWGRDGIMIYNDGYAAFAGGRHPELLGTPVLEGWPEAAEFNRRVMQTALAGEVPVVSRQALQPEAARGPRGRVDQSRL